MSKKQESKEVPAEVITTEPTPEVITPPALLEVIITTPEGNIEATLPEDSNEVKFALENYLTAQEFAAKVNIKAKVLRRYIRKGLVLGAHRINHRWYIPPDAELNTKPEPEPEPEPTPTPTPDLDNIPAEDH